MYAEIEESSYDGYGLRLTSVFTAFPTIVSLTLNCIINP